jgi:TATA-box binding protein (TBP) (component of TFIID and TFIIIB)
LTGTRVAEAVVTYSVLELCKNRAGYEAMPKERLKLDLRDVERTLQDAGFEPLANAGILLVVRWESVELSVFESGKLLFKTRDEADARVAMAAFRGAMGWT